MNRLTPRNQQPHVTTIRLTEEIVEQARMLKGPDRTVTISYNDDIRLDVFFGPLGTAYNFWNKLSGDYLGTIMKKKGCLEYEIAAITDGIRFISPIT